LPPPDTVRWMRACGFALQPAFAASVAALRQTPTRPAPGAVPQERSQSWLVIGRQRRRETRVERAWPPPRRPRRSDTPNRSRQDLDACRRRFGVRKCSPVQLRRHVDVQRLISDDALQAAGRSLARAPHGAWASLGLPPAALAVLQVPRGLRDADTPPRDPCPGRGASRAQPACRSPAPGYAYVASSSCPPCPIMGIGTRNRWIRSRSPGQRHQRSSKASLPRSEFFEARLRW